MLNIGYMEKQYVYTATTANTEQHVAWWGGEADLVGKTLLNVYASVVDGWTETNFVYSPPAIKGENISMRFSVAQKYTVVFKYLYLK